jgi:hypothetical protein
MNFMSAEERIIITNEENDKRLRYFNDLKRDESIDTLIKENILTFIDKKMRESEYCYLECNICEFKQESKKIVKEEVYFQKYFHVIVREVEKFLIDKNYNVEITYDNSDYNMVISW